jgi:hypothetical protein
MTSPRTPRHDVQPQDRALDADVPRLALGEGPQAICSDRGRQARAWRHRVYLHPPGLRSQDDPPRSTRSGSTPRRARRPGLSKRGGPKRCIGTIPHLEENFLRVLQDRTAGDPMRQEVRWTDLTYKAILRIRPEMTSRFHSFPCSAWECRPGRSASSFERRRLTRSRRGASKTAFPRRTVGTSE